MACVLGAGTCLSAPASSVPRSCDKGWYNDPYPPSVEDSLRSKTGKESARSGKTDRGMLTA